MNDRGATVESDLGKVIHVQFGPGGGRRVEPASVTPTLPAAKPSSAAKPRAGVAPGDSPSPSLSPSPAPSPSPTPPTHSASPSAPQPAAPALGEGQALGDGEALDAGSLDGKRRRDPTGDLYGRAEVARLFSIPESKLRYWDRIGLLSPSGQVGARRLYTFQDLIGVRTAKGLIERGVKLSTVRKTVDALRTNLPNVVRPLSELRVVADGQSVVVRDDKALFEPRTGQVVIDFDVRGLRDDVVRVLRPDALDPARRRAAYEAYLEGCRLDEDDSTLERAEACYRRAISLDPSLANALTNLGNLRFRRGDSKEARGLYEKALALDAEQAEAWYNLGFLAFERAEMEEAVRLFDRAVTSDPGFADAHFNLAMALEELTRSREARVHWETYLKLDPTGPWAEIARRHI